MAATGILSTAASGDANTQRNWGANADLNKQIAANTGYTGDFGGGKYAAWKAQQQAAGKVVNEGNLIQSPQTSPVQVPQINGLGYSPAPTSTGILGQAQTSPVSAPPGGWGTPKMPSTSPVAAPPGGWQQPASQAPALGTAKTTGGSTSFNENAAPQKVQQQAQPQNKAMAQIGNYQVPEDQLFNTLSQRYGYNGGKDVGSIVDWVNTTGSKAGFSYANLQGLAQQLSLQNQQAQSASQEEVHGLGGIPAPNDTGTFPSAPGSTGILGQAQTSPVAAPPGGWETTQNPYMPPTPQPVAATPTATTYQAAQLGNPSQWNIDAQQTAAGQLDQLLRNDSPFIQQARARAMQAANGRGLLNSSLAATAGESAAYDAALPLAQADAATYAKAASYNTDMGNQFAVQNAGFQNQAGQFNAGAQNTLTGQKLSADTSKYTADLGAQTQWAQAQLAAQTQANDLAGRIAMNNASITSNQLMQAKDILSKEGINTANLSAQQILAGINNLSAQQIARMNNESQQAVAQIQAQVSAANNAASNATQLAAQASANATSTANTAANIAAEKAKNEANLAANKEQNAASLAAQKANNEAQILANSKSNYNTYVANAENNMKTRIQNIQNNPNLTQEQKNQQIDAEHTDFQNGVNTQFKIYELPGSPQNYNFATLYKAPDPNAKPAPAPPENPAWAPGYGGGGGAP